MNSWTIRILVSAALSNGITATTACSAESEFVSGRVAKEIRVDSLSARKFPVTRIVTFKKEGRTVTGKIKMDVTLDGKIASLAISTNLVAEGIDPDLLTLRTRVRQYVDCSTKNGCAGNSSNTKIAACFAACFAACAAEIMVQGRSFRGNEC